MNVRVDQPPRLVGAAEYQLQQVYGYLFQLSEYLNVALNNLPENRPAEPQSETAAGSGQGGAGEYNQLRALIVNTAEVTRREMDSLETRLQGSYEALSQRWGSYTEQIEGTITATARDVVQSFAFQSQLDALDAQAAGFEAYRLRSEGYIRSGFLDYDDAGAPVLGIAIGQGLVSTTVTVDGRDYEQLDKTQSCAFYTADRVSFRINGTEVAYVSNRKLYIHHVEVTGDVILGKWHLSTANGFAMKWIGG